VESADAIIIGAGPAGSCCAENLAKAGFKVMVIDRRIQIGYPARCAGGIACHWVDELKLELPDEVIASKVNRVQIYAPNSEYVEVNLGKPIGLVLNRGKFDQWLARKAAATGAEFKVNTNAIGFKNNELITNNGALKARYYIGADGPISRVGKWAGINVDTSDWDMHLGVQRTIEVSSYPSDLIKIYFDNIKIPWGYAWVFPEDKNRVRVGLGVPKAVGEPIQKLNKFIEEHSELQGKVVEQTGGLIPTSHPLHTCVNKSGNVLLIGDAGRFTCSFTGGGIINGIISAKCAARAIIDGVPRRYDEYWKKELWSFLTTRYKLKQWIYKLRNEDYNELIEVLKEFEVKSMNPQKEFLRLIRHIAIKKPLLLKGVIKWFLL
jgi:digeranylgeranylglycerophospholipid reductase